MLFPIAHLPESCVGALPILANPIQPAANPHPRIVGDGAHVLVVQIKCVHKLAVDVKLELRRRCIADSYRARPAISFPAVQSMFGKLAIAVDGKHYRNRHVRAQMLGCVGFNPIHERPSFFPEADAEERVDSKSRVAYPGVAVIPVPRASNDFGQASGGSGDDRSGGLESEKLQSQDGSLDVLAPASLVRAGRKPLAPEP